MIPDDNAREQDLLANARTDAPCQTRVCELCQASQESRCAKAEG